LESVVATLREKLRYSPANENGDEMPDRARGNTGSQQYADWLKEELRRRNWSQSELGRRSGILPSVISRWLRCEWGPDASSALKVANALGVDVDFVLELAGHERRQRFPESTNARQLKSMIDHIDWYKPGRFNTIEGIFRIYKNEDELDDQRLSGRRKGGAYSSPVPDAF
jgi:transcriptional regulator with XRE-family HTH domain